MSDAIGDLLRFDSLGTAERLTGRDYKTDESTTALGFLMHLENGERKKAALEATNDTHWSINFEDALRVFESEGFTIVLDEPFTGTAWIDQPAPSERFVVMWNPLGILLHAESYGGSRMNSAAMNYAIRFHAKPEDVDWTIQSSRKWVNYDTDPVLVGHHDVREGFRYKLGRLRDAGTFVTPWPDSIMFYLHNYSAKGDLETETARIVALLPAEIRETVTTLSSSDPEGGTGE